MNKIQEFLFCLLLGSAAMALLGIAYALITKGGHYG